MLLMQQTGSLKIGEVIRYTITYIPSQDAATHSPPPALFLRVKNSCSAALRAVFMRGPYNLSVAAYPATYNPNEEFKDAESLGIPTFEPYLRAASAWDCELKIPERLSRAPSSRDESLTTENGDGKKAETVSWIVEISSQVVFSASAVVHYEVLLGKDQNCLTLDTSVIPRSPSHRRLSLQDRIRSPSPQTNIHKSVTKNKGIFSKAIVLKVEDTATLWGKPCLPENFKDDEDLREVPGSGTENTSSEPVVGIGMAHKKEKPRKFHLVILTHGLHSNIGADMLYLKESIDAAVKEAKFNAKERRRARVERKQKKRDNDPCQLGKNQNDESCKSPLQQPRDQSYISEEEEEEEEEEVVVRGYSGNVARTERGIKYLGKRLARYVLSMTHPEEPFQKVPKRRLSQAISHKRSESTRAIEAQTNKYHGKKRRAYQFTSISFIGHSLGGIVQTYAVAYIQKHWPNYFDQIKPINFIALATPFLGLSNENPTYVKFALDFGFIGRTGQDLGLAWSAPTIARSYLGPFFGLHTENSSSHADQHCQTQSEDKPLLQILPMGPAHTALKKFKNRTVYSNVVNDGIVPLRTSCLLFIDWQCLGKVEKAKRESGLMGKVAEWSWAEITGATSSALPLSVSPSSVGSPNENQEKIIKCPPTLIKVTNDNQNNVPESSAFSTLIKRIHTSKSPINDCLSAPEPKQSKIFQRSQTINSSQYARATSPRSPFSPEILLTLTDSQVVLTPPRTSVFESAGDLLVPPLPSVEYLLNFSSRPQSIFHDRIYYPCDIPPPVQEKKYAKRLSINAFRSSNETLSVIKSPKLSQRTDPEKSTSEGARNICTTSMKIEEKIARAYHRDLSWRKVLVRLEPDAHNNIIVRRMFANAHGWPVVKHLCDTHFSESAIYNSLNKSTQHLDYNISKVETQNLVYENKEINDGFDEEKFYNDSDLESEAEAEDELKLNLLVEPKIWL